MEGFRAIFQGVEDPRRSNATKHDLVEMLTIALLATMTGRSSCHAFALFAKYKLDFLRQFMPLRNGPPSHDAFSDLFNALDPEPLAAALAAFARLLLEGLGDDQIAIDGEALRGAFKDASNRSPLHLVQAFAPGAGLMLGQVRVDGKSNGTAAMPTLTAFWTLPGARRRLTPCTRSATSRNGSWRGKETMFWR